MSNGDIEALADRLAGVRSWAYIAHRADWLADPAKWAERTREVEARLSDALHERLTQRFVDRRTAVLVRDIGARGADALPVTVAADGEVSVGPEPIGHLAGFDFRVDPTARLADKRLLLAAAERRLGDELDRRANALLDAPDDAFELVIEEDGGLAVGWQGHVLARLAPGRSLLEPALRTARALDRLSAAQPRRASRAAGSAGSTRRSTAIWRRSKSSPRQRPTGRARRAFARSRRCSPMPAACFRAGRWSAPIAALEQADRQALHRLRRPPRPARRVPAAVAKPAAQHWRAALLRRSARASRCRACRRRARRRWTPTPIRAARRSPTAASAAQWLRIDLADRLASHAHKVRSAGGDEPGRRRARDLGRPRAKAASPS